MRIRRASPLLVLVLSSIARAKDSLSNDEILALNRAAPRAGDVRAKQHELLAEITSAAGKSVPTRVYKGTEDAPVDGLDGKPHAGPFVDTTPETTTSALKTKPTSLDKFVESGSLEQIPEKNDGVMNDENRPIPEKSTTGTEGGVSERDRERKLNSLKGNMPKEPKEAPPLPHSEEKHLEDGKKEKQGSLERESDEKAGKNVKAADAQAQKGAVDGALGLEKPKDLPEKPHNIPHPEPKGAKMSTGADTDGPPVEAGSGSSWLSDTMPYTEGKTNPADAGDWHEWFHSYVLSLTMILVSEIGDKTFLIAALMAMRHPRLLVFSAAFGALIAMTVLSAVLGHAVPTLLPKRWTTLAAAVLFFVFGVRMLREGLAMPKDSGVGEEMREVEAELEEKDHSRQRSSISAYTLEAGRGRKGSNAYRMPKGELSPPSSRSPTPAGKPNIFAGLTNLLGLVLSPAWVQTFIMTFLGEWGDRSQIATIAMAAGQDYWWVTLGAITGHAVCTGIAVIGGRALAGRVSMRVVTIGGAIAFLIFGGIYLFEAL